MVEKASEYGLKTAVGSWIDERRNLGHRVIFRGGFVVVCVCGEVIRMDVVGQR